MPLCTCGSHQRPVCRNKFSSSAIRDLGMPLPTELALQHVIKLFHLVLGIKPRCLCKLSVHFTTVQPNIIVCLFGFGFLCFFLSFLPSFLVFETGSYSVAKAGLESVSVSWYSGYMLSCLSPTI